MKAKYLGLLIFIPIILFLQSCEKLDDLFAEDGNLIIAADNTTSDRGAFSIKIDGVMAGSFVLEPNYRASFVSCDDDLVSVSQTPNVSIVTSVAKGKHKVELVSHGDNEVVVSWDITVNGCQKLTAIF
ncbi:hypothetical protein [Sphingobacterium hungaricum]|uniref:Uncharacterized protein n=1 Tax=Sphingobacterium hungaricum TaxID=2082723 RepID=A0A928YR73_9SPHI|nr:hypothetical protein [Sphingobacterium hungaricum]MBE8714357.1 hypothetical protein [Sphingobacterium hungaricum]